MEELDRLSLPFTDDSVPSEAELRIAQAQLVGWLEGLFHGIQTALFAQQMAARARWSRCAAPFRRASAATTTSSTPTRARTRARTSSGPRAAGRRASPHQRAPAGKRRGRGCRYGRCGRCGTRSGRQLAPLPVETEIWISPSVFGL